MSHDTYQAKKKFVAQELSRCIIAAHHDVKSMEYTLDEYPSSGALCETVIVHHTDGFIRRVCVTGDSLHAMIAAVNYALE